jgi:hypothetical protein
VDDIRAPKLSNEKRPIQKLRDNRPEILHADERFEPAPRNRVDGNKPRADAGIVAPAVEQPPRLDRLTPENSKRRRHDGNAERLVGNRGAGGYTHTAGTRPRSPSAKDLPGCSVRPFIGLTPTVQPEMGIAAP